MAKSKKKKDPNGKAKATSSEPDESLTEPTATTGDTPRYKEDINAFSVPIEDDKDYISGMPSEILNEILSYVIVHHDPERAAKEKSQGSAFVELPHVLLSLAAMSRHFRDHVDSFSQRELTRNKEMYRFKTNEDLEVADAERALRRSARLKENSSSSAQRRCYRLELVKAMQLTCIVCDGMAWTRALMANGAGCCDWCRNKHMLPTMNLSDALSRYDLKDWMLISTRKPGPRAKQTNLPTITYATRRTAKPFNNGWTLSYRFFKADVEKVARAVHGNVEEHMVEVRRKREERKTKKRDTEHRKLKIRYHQDALRSTKREKNREYHEKRLEFYQDPNCAEGYDWRKDDDDEYGVYYDIHQRLFPGCNCDWCYDERWNKYCPYGEWW